MKLLVMGLSGSGKTTVAEPLADLIGGVHLNADAVRTKYDDWDFTAEGRLRQAERMLHLADGVEMAGKIAIADFIAPTEQARQIFNADYTIWMDTIDNSGFPDTDQMFEPPTKVNYHVNKWFDDTHQQLVKVVNNYMLRRQDKPTERL
jgi:adenylylsulfate kinase